MKKNFDRFDIAMSIYKREYTYSGKNVTCKISARAKTPKAYENIFGKIEVVAESTATCHPDDEFDKELGEKIAEAKAEAKAYKQIAAIINKKWNSLMDVVEGIYPMKVNFTSKANRCIKHNAKYIKFLSKENTEY